jgi:hypothetical protein
MEVLAGQGQHLVILALQKAAIQLVRSVRLDGASPGWDKWLGTCSVPSDSLISAGCSSFKRRRIAPGGLRQTVEDNVACNVVEIYQTM